MASTATHTRAVDWSTGSTKDIGMVWLDDAKLRMRATSRGECRFAARQTKRKYSMSPGAWSSTAWFTVTSMRYAPSGTSHVGEDGLLVMLAMTSVPIGCVGSLKVGGPVSGPAPVVNVNVTVASGPT